MQAPMLIVPGVLSPQSDVNIYYLFLRVEYVSTYRQTHCNTAGNCCKYVGLHYNNTNNTKLDTYSSPHHQHTAARRGLVQLIQGRSIKRHRHNV